MKAIEARLNKKLGIDTDLFCMIHDNPEIGDNLIEIDGVDFEVVKNTYLYYHENEDTQSLKYMLFKTLK